MAHDGKYLPRFLCGADSSVESLRFGNFSSKKGCGPMSINALCRSLKNAGWSSLVARQAHNLKVAGSNPAPATSSGLSWIGYQSEEVGLIIRQPPDRGFKSRPRNFFWDCHGLVK